MIIFLVCFTFFFSICRSTVIVSLPSSIPYPPSFNSGVVTKKDGKGPNELEKMEADNNCFVQAYKDVPNFNCNFLENNKGFITLKYLDCYLQSTKRPAVPSACKEVMLEDEESLRTCTAAMSEFMFASYTEFHNHIDELCAIIQSQLWRRQTDDTVTRLTVSAYSMTTVLSESAEKQEALLGNQEVSLEQQKKLAEQISTAAGDFQVFKEDVGGLFGDMKQQFMLVQEKLGGLTSTVKQVFTTVMSIYGFAGRFESAAVFVLGVVASALLASLPSTRKAFPRLFLLWLLNLCFELLLRQLRLGSIDLVLKATRVCISVLTCGASLYCMYCYKAPLEAQLENTIKSVTNMKKDIIQELKQDSWESSLQDRGLHPMQFEVVRQIMKGVISKEHAAGCDSRADPDYKPTVSEPEPIRDTKKGKKSRKEVEPRRRNPPRAARPTCYRDPVYDWHAPKVSTNVTESNWKLLLETPDEFSSQILRSGRAVTPRKNNDYRVTDTPAKAINSVSSSSYRSVSSRKESIESTLSDDDDVEYRAERQPKRNWWSLWKNTDYSDSD
eukprot:Platyproteum_vivax@DN5032_c0_g1_i1.p1